MEVERGDVACVAVFVAGEGVDAVGRAVVDIFWGLEGEAWDGGCIVGAVDEPGRAVGLSRSVRRCWREDL